MTPFNTALNVARGMKQTTPKAIMSKPVASFAMSTVPSSTFQKKGPGQSAQTAMYGRAMKQAIKNTNVYR